MTDLLAGAAQISLRPERADLDEGVYLGGFGSYRQRRATGVLDEPQCRVLAISDGTTTLVIAALDLVGASGPLLAAIRAGASEATGLASANILLACTHSHGSPDTQGLWGGIPPAYAARIIEQSIAAISEAVRAIVPARIAAASTAFSGLVRNRRDWPQTDTALTSMRVTTMDGGAIATLVNYACHPTAIGSESTEISRDWCGFTADIVEREMGGVAMYINGALGDANPLYSGSTHHAKTLGTSVAAWAIESLQEAEGLGGRLSIQTEPLELPVNIDRLREGILANVALAGLPEAEALAAGVRSRQFESTALALHAAGRADLAQFVAALAGISERTLVKRDGVSLLRTQCSFVRIGELAAVAAPGEMLTRLGLPLRSALPGSHRLILGLTHDTLGYFIPEDEWMRRPNSYEETVSLGRKAGTLLVEKLLHLAASDSA
jgi:hypothetical protein